MSGVVRCKNCNLWGRHMDITHAGEEVRECQWWSSPEKTWMTTAGDYCSYGCGERKEPLTLLSEEELDILRRICKDRSNIISFIKIQMLGGMNCRAVYMQRYTDTSHKYITSELAYYIPNESHLFENMDSIHFYTPEELGLC